MTRVQFPSFPPLKLIICGVRIFDEILKKKSIRKSQKIEKRLLTQSFV